jgi:hypothetical protein
MNMESEDSRSIERPLSAESGINMQARFGIAAEIEKLFVKTNKQYAAPPDEKPEGGDVVQSMRVGEECMKARAGFP